MRITVARARASLGLKGNSTCPLRTLRLYEGSTSASMLPMKDLTDMFVAAGCENVRSYIQSGNVIFSAAPRVSAQVAALVGRKSPSASDIRRRWSPSAHETNRGRRFEITPFSGRRGRRNAPRLVPGRPAGSAPARLASIPIDRHRTRVIKVRGAERYLQLPNGVARSKADECLFRLQACDDRDQQELANGHEAARVDAGLIFRALVQSRRKLL